MGADALHRAISHLRRVHADLTTLLQSELASAISILQAEVEVVLPPPPPPPAPLAVPPTRTVPITRSRLPKGELWSDRVLLFYLSHLGDHSLSTIVVGTGREHEDGALEKMRPTVNKMIRSDILSRTANGFIGRGPNFDKAVQERGLLLKANLPIQPPLPIPTSEPDHQRPRRGEYDRRVTAYLDDEGRRYARWSIHNISDGTKIKRVGPVCSRLAKAGKIQRAGAPQTGMFASNSWKPDKDDL